MSRFVPVAVLLALVLAALPAVAAPRALRATVASVAPAALDREFMGMVIRDPYYEVDLAGNPNRAAQDRMGELLASAGVRWVRLDFLADPDGHVNFAKYDYFTGTVAPRHGFKVLGLLGTATISTWVTRNNQAVYYPILLNSEPATKTHQVYGSALNQYMIDWLDEALRVAEHYSGVHPEARRVHAFEIFNEVNRLFGDGTNLDARLEYAGLNPVYVARIQAKFYRVCKNTDGSLPSARCPADTKIIVGGLHPKGTSNRRLFSWQPETFKYTDQEYLQAMYESAFSDFKNNSANKLPWLNNWPVDGVGYHPYPAEIVIRPSNVPVEHGLDRMRTTINAYDPGKKFWITEVGYNVGQRVGGVTQTEAGQAAFMRDVYTSLAARGDVANVFWFKYEDFPPATGANAQRWGIVRIPFTESASCPGGACYAPSGQPASARASYFAYRELAGLPPLDKRIFAPLISR
jgi:hypothetical protein